MTGKFITLEGLDGCGKTTQLYRIEEWLRTRGYTVVTTAEPGGTEIGRAIRRVLLDSRNAALTPLAELLLYAADRAQHVVELIRPALAAGHVVLSDRYTDATLAFQGYSRGFDLDLCRQLNALATNNLTPDLTLLYDLEVEVALGRISARKHQVAAETEARGYDESRLDNERVEFHRRVRAGYQAIAAAEPGRVKVIDAAGDVEAVWQLTQAELEQFFAAADSALRDLAG